VNSYTAKHIRNNIKIVLNHSTVGEVHDQGNDQWRRFAVIKYDQNGRQFVFSARQSNDHGVSSYICQLQHGVFKFDDTQLNSTDSILLCCFTKHDLL